MKTGHLIFIGMLGICLLSCKKYLDQKPNNNRLVPTSIVDLQGMLDDAAKIMNQDLTPSYGEASSDDYFLQQTVYDGRPTREQQVYLWQPSEYNFNNDWAASYKPVYNSNYCLEMIDKIGRTSQNEIAWTNIKGSALFYRAYNFLNLCWNYTKSYDESTADVDLGIALRLGSDFNLPSKRANVRQSYERIINDVKEAIPYLPMTPSHSFRPSKASAYGLLARVFLSMRLYDSAYRYSDLCLQLKSDLIDYKNPSDPGLFGSVTSGTTAVFRQFNKETIFYTETNTTNPVVSTLRAKIDTSLFSLYSVTDLRRTGFFRADGNYQRFRGSYAQSTTIFFSGIATDEIYLIKAECLARKGDKDAAMMTLNTLLFKRHTSAFTGLSATTALNALDIILLERRKELIMRGLRWMDIKRLNKEGRNIVLTRLMNGLTYNLQPNANYYALPLPNDIINLTDMPQNPY